MGIFQKLLEGVRVVAKKRGATGRASAPGTKSFVSRAPRIPLAHLNHIHFSVKSPIEIAQVPLANLSTSGVGFVREAVRDWPDEGSLLRGAFLGPSGETPCSMTLVHVSPKVVGCRFESHLNDIRQMVNRYFQFELEALRMVRVRAQHLKAQPDGNPHWFTGDQGSDLFFVENEGRISRFRLTLFGNYFEAGKGQPLKFGHVVDDADSGDLRYKASELVRYHGSADPEAMRSAVKFLLHLENLTDSERSQLVRYFNVQQS